MGCSSRPVGEVSSTRVFARPLPGGAQALVYAMRFAADEALAMVLPLPVAPGAGVRGARFVDLSATPGFFAELDRGWPPLHAPVARGAPQRLAPLVVHTLYAQTPGRPSSFRSSPALGWIPSDGPLGRLGGPAAELVVSSDVGFRAVLRGDLPNRDVWVSIGARPTEALVARVYGALFGGAGEGARALLAALPELPGEDRFEVALAALRLHQGERGGPEGLDARLSSIDRDTFEAGRTPALRAWRRSGARYDPVEGARLARADEAAWEAWLDDPRAP